MLAPVHVMPNPQRLEFWDGCRKALARRLGNAELVIVPLTHRVGDRLVKRAGTIRSGNYPVDGRDSSESASCGGSDADRLGGYSPVGGNLIYFLQSHGACIRGNSSRSLSASLTSFPEVQASPGWNLINAGAWISGKLTTEGTGATTLWGSAGV